ncbi:MAG: hypothetical protein R2752_08995 [Vicinamibacterales bacterium]
MTDREFEEIITRAGAPGLIPGIYNYCDRWCERCPFTARCLLFLDLRDMRAPAPRAEPAATPEAADAEDGQVARESLEQALGLVRRGAERLGVTLSMDSRDHRVLMARLDAHRARARADPLVELATRLLMTTLPIVRTLGPVVRARGDARAVDALEVLGRMTHLLAGKTYRAVSSALRAAGEIPELAEDANGTAKVARLAAAEARDAWRVLMEAGRAAADGVPAQMVRLLDELDRRLAARFPAAMAFVRPGFDDRPNDLA